MPKSSSKKTASDMDQLPFEQAMNELQSIVQALEEQESPHALEDAIKLFERGQALVTRCNALLEQAQLKVQKLSGESLIAFDESSE